MERAPHRLSDEELVASVRAGNIDLFEPIMRRYNQRLYRIVFSILRNESEAEDVVQDALVRAYMHLDQYAGKAKFSTWLTKIAIYEAYSRARQGSRVVDWDEPSAEVGNDMEQVRSEGQDPEQKVYGQEVRILIETAIQNLPPNYATIFMPRDVEELSTEEAAECLGITEENVKVRLHRARLMLREALHAQIGPLVSNAFPFAGAKCDAMVARVMGRIRVPPLN